MGSTGYSFDARNRLVAGSDGTAASWSPAGARTSISEGGVSTEAVFDALGRPVAVGDVDYAWDAQGRIVSRSEGGESEAFAYAGEALDPIAVDDLERGTDDSGEPVSVDGTLTTVNGHTDIVAGTDGTGSVEVGGFDPFGQPAGGTGGPFGFQGDWTDPATGEVWMGARTYDPGTGAFTSRDTWAGLPDQPVTLNRHTYANADPLNHTDPDGHLATAVRELQQIAPYVDPAVLRQMDAAISPFKSLPNAVEAAKVTVPGTVAGAQYAQNTVVPAARQMAWTLVTAAIYFLAVVFVAWATWTMLNRLGLLDEPNTTDDPDPPPSPLANPPIVDWTPTPGPTVDPDPGEEPEPEPEPGGAGAGDCISGPFDTLRHYTTADAATSIAAGHRIVPGGSGKIWVTPDVYVDGPTAQNMLALDKTPDGYFEIPVARIVCPSDPTSVRENEFGDGGGTEITTTSPIDVAGLPFNHF